MNTHDPIEQLFSEKLGESFERNGSTTWEQLQAKRKSKHSFWKFSPKRLNIFYIGMLAAGSAAAIYSGIHGFSPKSLDNQKSVTYVHQSTTTQSHKLTTDSPVSPGQNLESTPQTAHTINKASNPNTQNKTTLAAKHQTHNDTTTQIDQLPLTGSRLTSIADSSHSQSSIDSIQSTITPTKTIVVVHKQAVVVKDTSVKRVTKHVRRRF